MRASLGGLGPLALLILCHVGPSELSGVKPGECPFQYMACDYPPPYMHQCNEDSGCPGTQKCCLNFCHRECRGAMPAKGKPGTCPPHYRHMFPDRDDTCHTDKDCKGEQKCCDWQGGFTCVAPVRAKTFGCPKKDAACKTTSYLMCEDENDCWGFNRCCDSQCTLPCEDPVIEKKGLCPMAPSYPTCADLHSPPENECSTDKQCPGVEKCCEYGCKLQCLNPVHDKVGICPDFNRSICLHSRPAPAECSHDNQCPGTQRCCCHGNCRMECTSSGSGKPGSCPPASKDCPLPLPAQRCEDDSDCDGKQKCCSQCGIKCMDPLISENPGFCPVDPEKENQCGYLPPPQCRNDTDCKAHEKCCLFGCGVQCVKALPAKPGICPYLVANCRDPLDKPECRDDGDCPLNKKCCQLCGNKCLEAVADHEGICPPYNSKSLVCPAITFPSCRHDSTCEADRKCCTVGCTEECVKALKEKVGDCPKVAHVNESKDICHKCNNDKDCPGNDKCCAGSKGRECHQPPANFMELPIPEKPKWNKH
ncbi:uncharacterized protein LOC144764009 isoform X2 [Lissotriton helveticus]